MAFCKLLFGLQSLSILWPFIFSGTLFLAMAEAQQMLLLLNESKGANSSTEPVSQRTVMSGPAENYMVRWLRVALYTIFGIVGQTSALMLSRLYFEKGGNSKWVGTLTQVIGFPILLLPYYFISRRPEVTAAPNSNTTVAVETKSPPSSLLLLVGVYVYLGLLMAANGYLYSVGFEYLPVSIVALISASQLAFNAFFSYFLNAQKFTPFIINSLLLLTISSVLTVANNSSERPQGVTDGEYVTGFVCTIFAAASYGLLLASQQLAFRKVLKNQSSLKVVMELTIYLSLVASIVTFIGFFASGDCELLKAEMDRFELGTTSYIMTLVWTAVGWQVSILAGVGLVFELSALLANVIAGLGLPINTTAAMIVFHDKMSTVKGISLLLAIWGVISYAYQQHLDDLKLDAEDSEVSDV